jgi:PncC family amidohydrolase
MNAERLVSLCKEHHLTISCAESVTGGMVASAIVDIPGSSAVFSESYVTYSNEAKTKILSINPAYFLSNDVVSEKIALEMAKGLKKRTMAEVVIATTGVAGPSGGTKAIPVGTVCIACGHKDHFATFTKHFEGNRNEIRRQACEAAITCAIDTILGD